MNCGNDRNEICMISEGLVHSVMFLFRLYILLFSLLFVFNCIAGKRVVSVNPCIEEVACMVGVTREENLISNQANLYIFNETHCHNCRVNINSSRMLATRHVYSRIC